VVDAPLEARVPQRADLERDGLVLAGAERLPFRDLEAQAQAADVHDRRQDVALLHPLPLLDLLGVDHAARGRAHLRAADVLQRDVPGRLHRRGLGGQAVALAAGAVQLLLRHQLLARQLLAPLQVLVRPLRVGLGLAERGLRARRLEAVPLGIDAREDGSGGDPHAFVEEDGGDGAVDLGRHLHDLVRFERAHGLDAVHHVANGHGLDAHGHAAAAARPGGGRALGPAAGGDGENRADAEDGGKRSQNPSILRVRTRADKHPHNRHG
jgi:hypothetical protein